MKKFEFPEIEVIELDYEDVIRTSGEQGDLPGDQCSFGQSQN